MKLGQLTKGIVIALFINGATTNTLV